MKSKRNFTIYTVLLGFRINYTDLSVREGKEKSQIKFYNYDAEEYWEFECSDLIAFMGDLLDKVVESEKDYAKFWAKQQLKKDFKKLFDL